MRKTIGVLTNFMGGAQRPYEREFSNAVADAAKQHDSKVIFYEGGLIRSAMDNENQRNFVFDLCRGDRLDGLLILSAVLGGYVKAETIYDFCAGFGDIPKISAGMQVPGIPSVLINNYYAMRTIIDHIFERHEPRSVVYIGGPINNIESRERYRAVCDGLSAGGITLDPELYLTGIYTKDSGRKAAETLLTRHMRPFDTVISANDEMAFGFIEYMAEHGISCPGDYRIVGFDNVPASSLFIPALTTVEQSTLDLGDLSFELLCQLLDGDTVPEVTWLSTHLIVRDSCGCQEGPLTGEKGASDQAERVLSLKRELLRNERQEYVLNTVSEGLINTTTMEQLRFVLDRDLPKLPEIQSCAICLFGPDEGVSSGIEPVITYTKDSGTRYERSPSRFATTSIIDDPISRFRIIEGLHYKDRKFGVIILEANSLLFSVFNLLREQISATLNTIRTFSRIEVLNGELTQKVERLSALRVIDKAIMESHSVTDLLEILLEQVITQQKVDAAAISLLDPRTGEPERTASRGFSQGYPGESGAEAAGFAGFCSVPLMAHGRQNGTMELFNREPLTRDADWGEFLDTLAGQASIAIESVRLLEDLTRANRDLRESYNTTIEGWSRALDLRDHETEGHCMRVAMKSVELGRKLGLNDQDTENLYRGALLHDIGKVGIPDSILLKPGPLTDDEWKIMSLHPQYAHELLSPIRFLLPALSVPWCHHEKWDGSGYPQGLKGTDIPLFARIFAVIDVWDALSSDRPYRGPWKADKIREYIKSLSGIQFDPEIAAAFLEMMESYTD